MNRIVVLAFAAPLSLGGVTPVTQAQDAAAVVVKFPELTPNLSALPAEAYAAPAAAIKKLMVEEVPKLKKFGCSLSE